MYPLPSAPDLLSGESKSIHVLFSYIYCFFHFIDLHWSSKGIMTSVDYHDYQIGSHDVAAASISTLPLYAVSLCIVTVCSGFANA